MAEPLHDETTIAHLRNVRLHRTNTADHIADVLRNMILRGEIEAGTAVRELQWAAPLGVSRNTLREALRILRREGLVVQGSHRVARVVTIRPEDVLDVFTIRRVLERGAIEEIQRRDELPDLSALAQTVSRLRHAGEDQAWWEISEGDLAFHTAVISLARSPRLNALYAQSAAEIRLTLSLWARLHVNVEELVDRHSRLLALLEEGEFEEFIRLSETFSADAAERVTRVLRGEAEAPPTAARPVPGMASGLSAARGIAHSL
jgi:DNA-binding GntR family transcriptional regulator